MYPNRQFVKDLKKESPNVSTTYWTFSLELKVTNAVPVGMGGFCYVLNSCRVLLIVSSSLLIIYIFDSIFSIFYLLNGTESCNYYPDILS